MSTVVCCPSCGLQLTVPTPACPTCNLRLTGPEAAELWATDQQIATLQARRLQLLAQLRPATVSGPGPATVTAASPAPVLPSSPAIRAHSRWSGQQLLLASGALLLLTAAAVFLAVTWSALGVAGQVAVMGALTVAAALGSLFLSRRELGATAETLAVLAVGLAVLDAAAAHGLNLAGLGRTDAIGYGAVAAGLLGAAFAAVAALAPAVRTYSVAAVTAAGVVPVLTALYADWGATASAFIFLLAAVAAVLVRQRLSSRWSLARVLLVGVAGTYLLLTWLLAFGSVLDEPLLGAGGLAALISWAGSAAVAWRSRLYRGLAATERPIPAAAAVLAAVATLVALTGSAEQTGAACSLLAASASAAAGWLICRPHPLTRHPGGVGAGVAVLVATAALAVSGLTYLDGDGGRSLSWAALVLALTVAAASAALVAVRRSSLRAVAGGYGAGAFALAAGAVAYPVGSAAVAVGVVVAAVALAAVAGWRRGTPEELAVAACSALAALVALGLAADLADGSSSRVLAGVLAVVGLVGFGYGLLPGRGPVALLGVVAGSAACWVLLDDLRVEVLEAYTLPAAALLGAVSAVRLHRRPEAPSWLTVGPPLSVALLPSAVAAVDDPGLTRSLLVLVVGAGVLVAGVLLRWQAPLLIATLALVVVAVAQLGPYAVGLPRWLTFGTVGLILLVLGARYEQRRRNARQAVRWVAGLH